MASCPAGYDCLLQQTDGVLFANGPVDCSSFLGFECPDGKRFDVCPAGSYCPDPSQQIKCPSGHWCPTASAVPFSCKFLSICDEGAAAEWWFLLVVIMTVLIIAAYVANKVAVRKRLAKAANDKALHEGGPDGSKTRPVSSIAFEVRAATPTLVWLEFSDVSVSISGDDGQPRTILDNVTGRFTSGHMAAIMGASGSGKSTFLNALCGRVPISSGAIKLNGLYDLHEATKVFGFVPQEDILLPMLTVRDVILHSALTRLPADWSRAQKERQVETVIDVLGLTSIADTIIGNESKRGISGGQKKRTSIGVELVARPLVLFCDEPTSGLDASSARDVVAALQRISNLGTLVITVIHQPRFEVYEMFDDILFLAKGGKPFYLGPTSKTEAHFASLGFPLPEVGNPADFYIDAIAGRAARHEAKVAVAPASAASASVAADKPRIEVASVGGVILASPEESIAHRMHAQQPERKSESGGGGGGDVVFHEGDDSTDDAAAATAAAAASVGGALPAIALQQIGGASAAASASPAPHDSDRKLDTGHHHQPPEVTRKHSTHSVIAKDILHRKTASLGVQFLLELRRCFYMEVRDLFPLALDTFLAILPGLAMGVARLGNSDLYRPPLPLPIAEACPGIIRGRCINEAIQDYGAIVCFFLTMVVGAAGTMLAVKTFGKEMSVFQRERQSGMNVVAYWAAKCVYDLWTIGRAAFIMLAFYMLMSSPRGTFWEWFGILFTLYWSAFGLAYLVSSLVRYSMASVLSVVIAIAFAITNGLTPDLDQVSGWGPVQVFWYISANRWGSEAIVSLTSIGQPNLRIAEAAASTGYNIHNYSVDVAAMFVIGLGYRLLALAALLRKDQPSLWGSLGCGSKTRKRSKTTLS